MKPDELGCAISVEGKMEMMTPQPDRPALEVITTAALLAGELARLLLLVPPGCRKVQVRISTKHRGEAPELGMQSWHAAYAQGWPHANGSLSIPYCQHSTTRPKTACLRALVKHEVYRAFSSRSGTSVPYVFCDTHKPVQLMASARIAACCLRCAWAMQCSSYPSIADCTSCNALRSS